MSPFYYTNIWFTALVTRIRGTGRDLDETQFKWAKVPNWAPPLVVYKNVPTKDGDPSETWPPIDEYSRILATQRNRSNESAPA